MDKYTLDYSIPTESREWGFVASLVAVVLTVIVTIATFAFAVFVVVGAVSIARTSQLVGDASGGLASAAVAVCFVALCVALEMWTRQSLPRGFAKIVRSLRWVHGATLLLALCTALLMFFIWVR